jgi:hypothetical protein
MASTFFSESALIDAVPANRLATRRWASRLPRSHLRPTTLDFLRGAIVKMKSGRGVPLRYSTSWNLYFWRVLPLKSEKLTLGLQVALRLGHTRSVC